MRKVAKFGILALLLVSLVGSAIAFNGRNQEAKDALEKGDYGAWKNAMTSGLTEEKFNHMQERHGQRAERRTERQAMMGEACETGVAPEGFEENFEAICELHEARQNGAEPEELKELAEELGLKGPGVGCGGRFGKGKR